MSYERRIIEIEAVQLVRAIYDSEGNRLADKGEWIIVDGENQFYMKDEDFRKEFIKKPPEKEIVTETVTITQPYGVPMYINPCPPVYITPCSDPWPNWPWWKRGDIICWSDSKGYINTHPNDKIDCVSFNQS